MAGRSNIELTVSMQLEREALITRQILDGMNRSAHDAGSESAKAWAEGFESTALSQDKRIAKAYEGAVTALSRTDELRQKSLKTYDSMNLAQEREVEARTKLNELEKSGTATTEELTRAKEEYRQATDDSTVATNRHITMLRQAERAESQRIASLRRVIQAQNDAANEASAGQGLLTAGKFISAIRAVAIPVVGVAAASMAAQVAAAAAIASQSLWLIPGAAMAGAAGIGTLSIATMGFGDAIKDIGDPEKFAEAIQNLSPNAQQAALAIQALMEPLTAVKNSIQDALFANFGPMINELTNQYLPMIQQLGTGIAGAFNDALSGLFDYLMTPETQLMIRQTIQSISDGFANLAPALAPFSAALMDIINVGASFLPGIGDSLTRAANSFADFISEARASGQLAEWLRDGMDAVGLLWQGVKALGGAFADLAPIGKEILPGMVAGIELIAQAIPPVVEALSGIAPPFGEAAQALQSFHDLFKPLFGDMANDSNTLSTVLKRIRTDFDLITVGVKDFIATLTPFTTIINTLAKLRGISTGDPMPGIPSSLELANRYAAADLAGKPAIPSGFYRTRDGKLRPRPMADPISAGLPGYPSGGYAVPAPPPEKGSGGKADEPPFSADPSLWSVDAIPVAPSGLTAANSQIDSLAALAAMPPFNLSLSSDVRNEPGSWHNSGEAGDFSNSSGPTAEMHAFAMFLAQNFGGMIEELIYSDPVRGDVLIGGGRDVRGTGYYGPDTLAQHQNHVHVAMKDAVAPYLNAMLQGGGIPGAMQGGGYVQDPEAIMRAENAFQAAKNDVEEKRLRLLELEAKGNASQLELLTARNNVAQAENKYREAEINLAQARQGKYKEFDSKMKGVAKGISDIGAALADDFGISEGLPGIAKWLTTFLANLAFAPMIGALSAISAANPIQGGHGLVGMMGAQAMANGTYPSYSGGQGMSAAPAAGFGAAVPGYGPAVPPPIAAAPTIVTPMTPAGPVGLGPAPGPLAAGVPAASAIGPAPIGGGIGSGAGFPGMSGPPAAMTPQTSGAPRAASPGGGFQGIGGLPLEAAMTATAGLDLLAPGASQAAQIGIKVANRTAGYIGQLGAIGVGGLLETFLPNNSSIADPSKSWLGKIAAGVAGARPAMPNSAGSPAPAQPAAAGQQQPGQGGGPLVKIDNIVNNTPDSGQTLSSQIARMSMSGYASRGGR